MSIITDALRKAQAASGDGTKSNINDFLNALSRAGDDSPADISSAGKKSKAVLLSLIILLLLASTAALYEYGILNIDVEALLSGLFDREGSNVVTMAPEAAERLEAVVEEESPEAEASGHADTADVPAEEDTAEVIVQEEPPAEQTILQGIMYAGSKPLAVINNQIFSEGEAFDDIRVVNIRTESVVIETDGSRKILHLKR